MKKRLFSAILVFAVILAFCCLAYATGEERKSGPFSYTLKGNGTAIITQFNWNSVETDDIYIPQLIDGYTVTEIGPSAFNWGFKSDTLLSHDNFIKWLTDIFYPRGFDKSGGIIVYDKDQSWKQKERKFGFSFVGKPVNVILPNTITTIGDYAFFCTQVSSVSIPSSVKIIGSGAFAGCINISQFSVDSANTEFATIDGVLYNKKKKELIAAPMAKYGKYPISSDNKTQEITVVPQMGEPFIIPEGIKSIGDFAFYGFALTGEKDGIVGIKVPDSLQSIGKYAFFMSYIGSTKQDYIINPNNDKCPVLSFTNVSMISDSAFERAIVNCILDFPSITEIGNRSFEHCCLTTNKENSYFTYPQSLKKLGEYTFFYSILSNDILTSLAHTRDLVLDLSLTKITEIPDHAFSLNDYNDKSKNDGRFSNQLLTIHFPTTLQRIGKNAFELNLISSLTFPVESNITSIDDRAFYKAQFDQDLISIPDSVTELGDESFFCDKLITLYIPASVTRIGSTVVDRSKTTLFVDDGSYAALYASENGIPFNIFGAEDTSWLND